MVLYGMETLHCRPRIAKPRKYAKIQHDIVDCIKEICKKRNII